MSKSVAVFGAGTGLGAAVARRFGREGYRVALVARNAGRLAGLAAELATEGIEAEAFPADLTRTAGVPELIERIRARFGSIDVVEYAPITTDEFTPALALDVPTAQRYSNLYLLTLIEIVRAVLPEMQARGEGGILASQGISAVHPRAGLSGVGPAMAAARNYLLTLSAELAGTGVYAGVLLVAAIVVGSEGHRAMISGDLAAGMDLSQIPMIEPAELADSLWTMFTKREPAELIAPAV